MTAEDPAAAMAQKHPRWARVRSFLVRALVYAIGLATVIALVIILVAATVFTVRWYSNLTETNRNHPPQPDDCYQWWCRN